VERLRRDSGGRGKKDVLSNGEKGGREMYLKRKSKKVRTGSTKAPRCHTSGGTAHDGMKGSKAWVLELRLTLDEESKEPGFSINCGRGTEEKKEKQVPAKADDERERSE